MLRFVRSYYHTERESLRGVFYSAMRGGHLVADASHDIRRETFPGHEMIYCLKGRGIAILGGHQYHIAPRQLLWVNCWHPHHYFADAEDPWEVYWLRIDGPGLDAYASIIRAITSPQFEDLDDEVWRRHFESAFELLENPNQPEMPSKMHVQLATMLGLLYEQRCREGDLPVMQIPHYLEKPLQRMRNGYAEHLRLPDLAQMAGMSVSHFIRSFRQVMGTSPIDWLRQERIAQAKHRLLESNEPVKEIARQCGYRDPYFFSKDFHKIVGMPPTRFREQGSAGLEQRA